MGVRDSLELSALRILVTHMFHALKFKLPVRSAPFSALEYFPNTERNGKRNEQNYLDLANILAQLRNKAIF